MSKDNLDNFFQQKANQRSFEFEDDYWKEMELLLNDEEDKKAPMPFWWQNRRMLLGSLIAIMAIGALYVMLKQNPKQSNSNNLELTTQNNSNTNNSSSNTINQTIGNGNISSINSNNTITDNSTNALNNSSNANNVVNSSNSKTSTTQRSNNTSENRNTVRSTQRSSNNRNNHSNNSSNSSNSKSNNNPSSVVSKNTTNNTNNATASNSNSKGNTTSNNKNPNSKSPNGLFSSGEGKGNSWISHRPDGTLYSDYEKTLSEETKFNFLELIGLSEIEGIVSELKTTLSKPEKEDKTDPPSPQTFIAIGLYAGGSRYFDNVDAPTVQPYSPFVGVYGNLPISKNLSFTTGLNYWTRGNINASLSGDSTVYNFGFERITTTDVINRATYLEVPLSLKYRIREKHIAEIGGNFSYLLTAQGSRSITISSDFGSTTQSFDATNGYKKWLSSYDIALRLGYHYQWNERSTIGLQWQYGLTDITPNNTYGNTLFDRNHQFRVRLAYDLIRIQTNKK